MIEALFELEISDGSSLSLIPRLFSVYSASQAPFMAKTAARMG